MHEQSYFEYEQSHEDSQLLSDKIEVSNQALSPTKEDASLQMLKQIEMRRMELTSRSNSPPQEVSPRNQPIIQIDTESSRRKPSQE